MRHLYFNWLFCLLIILPFTIYAQAPTITSFSPGQGKVGSLVVLTGTNYDLQAQNNIVFFGGVKADVISAGPTQLTVKVPQAASFSSISVLNKTNYLTGYSVKSFSPVFEPVGPIVSTFFGAPQNISANSYGQSRLVDIDGDGRPDLTFASRIVAGVIVYRNAAVEGQFGPALFDAPKDIAVPGGISFAVEDVDGDGKPDFVVGGELFVCYIKNNSTPGNISFAEPVKFTAPGGVIKVFIKDLNKDGKPDILFNSVRDYKSSIYVYQNNAAQGIITATSLSMSTVYENSGATSLALADIDTDGKPDLGFVYDDANTISLLQNASTPDKILFEPRIVVTAAGSPSDIDMQDLDGDGKPDIVVCNAVGRNVSVFQNKYQSGGFSASMLGPKTDFATGGDPLTVKANDIDGDGKPEILAVCTANGKLSIFKNLTSTGQITGTSFEPRVNFDTPLFSGFSSDVSIGDIDGDERPDLVIANYNFAIFRNNPVYAPVISSMSTTHADAGTDVTISGLNFSPVATNNAVYFGVTRAKVNAASATQLSVTVPLGATVAPVSISNIQTSLTVKSDINFVASAAGAKKKSLNALDFEKTTELTPALPSLQCVNFADIDGDGKPDMFVSHNEGGFPVVSIYRNISAKGTIAASSFSTKISIKTSSAVEQIKFQDMNGDGKPDMLIRRYGGVVVYQNNTQPGKIDATSFSEPVTAGASGASDFYIADIDGDGRLDVIGSAPDGASNGYSYTITRNLSTEGQMRFDGSMRFNKTNRGSNRLNIADVDGDGKTDIVFASDNGILSVVQNLSTKDNIIMGEEVIIPALTAASYTSYGVSSVKMLDLNADNKPDMIIAQGSMISVFKNVSQPGLITAASFEAPIDFIMGKGSGLVTFADMNGDGKPDFVAEEPVPSVLLNNSEGGNISFAAKVDLTNNSDFLYDSALSVNVCDVDGDGFTDLIFRNSQKVLAARFNPQPDTPFGNAPVVTSFTPSGGLIAGNVQISGSNFNPSPEANIVYFGATRAKVTEASATRLKVEAPAGSTYAPLKVLNTSNSLWGASTIPFVAQSPAPVIIDENAFKTPVVIPGIGKSPRQFSMGDIDGDNKPDMVLMNSYPAYAFNISVFLNNSTTKGNVIFAAPQHLNVPNTYTQISLCDIDGDGKLDIMATNLLSNSPGGVNVFLNKSTKGNVSFSLVTISNTSIKYHHMADMNGDGKPDLICLDSYAGATMVYANISTPGQIVFAKPVIFNRGADAITVCDLDGDQKPEIISLKASYLNIYKNISADGGFAFKPGISTVWDADAFSVVTVPYVYIHTGDLDGDGKADIVLNSVGNNKITIYKNTSQPGIISLGGKQVIDASNNVKDLKLADVNGDGMVDIAMLHQTENTLNILLNKSTSGGINFAEKVSFSTHYKDPVCLNVIDLDGDDKADVIYSYDYDTSYAVSTVYGAAVFINGGSMVPVPTITANGPTVFKKGEQVILTANPGTGYSYAWSRNGAVLQGANTASINVTEAGYYVVAISKNSETKESLPTEVAVLPPSNFLVSATSVTCKGMANGIINVSAQQPLNYTAHITKNGKDLVLPFTQKVSIDSLVPGTYNLCVKITGQPDFKQCYDLVITEPKDLAVYSTVNKGSNTIDLSLSGASTYTVTLNSKTYTTSSSFLSLALDKGSNKVSVSTDKPCQGTIDQVINLSGNLVPYPNPFLDNIYINLGEANVRLAVIKIYNVVNGKLVFSQSFSNRSGVLQLPATSFDYGLYSLILNRDGEQNVFKIIKK